MNIFEFDKVVAPLVGLKPSMIPDTPASGILFTGEFPLHDYMRGYLEVKLIFKESKGLFSGLSITTIDDGIWQAPISPGHSIDVSKFINEFRDSFGVTLPSEESLNNFLTPYGMYGPYW